MSYSPSGLFPFGECRPPEWEAAIASSMLFPGIIWQHCHQPALFRLWLPVGRDWRREGLTYCGNKGDRGKIIKGIKRLSLLSREAAATRELAKRKPDYSPVFPVKHGSVLVLVHFLLTLQ